MKCPGRQRVKFTNPCAWRRGLQLGTAATLNVGTTPGTVAAGDDPRFIPPAPTWIFYASQWSVPPIRIATVMTPVPGNVFEYTRGATKLYRLVPSPYTANNDKFFSHFNSGILSGLLAARPQ
jgi:hypothetical protein